MQINSAVFVVTGAASGLGAATAETLLARGACVVAVDRVGLSSSWMSQNSSGSGQVLGVLADVTQASDARQVIAEATRCFGTVHGLINCAGIAPAEKLLGRDGPHSLERFEEVIRVNLIGSFNLIRLAAQQMSLNAPNAEGERGVIINTASVAAFEGQIGQVAYSASKAGVIGMTLPLARELAGLGIRVMAIAPGVFETPMLSAMPEKVRLALSEKVPFPKRLGRPDEFAALVCQIIENSMLNAEVIRLDGALRMA